MALRAYRLAMRSALHVGDQGIGAEVTHAYVPSDTLFSAVVVTWLKLPDVQPGPDALLRETEAPPLLLSSAFPYAGDVLLLPKPAIGLSPAPLPNESGKKFRRVRWVSSTLFTLLTSAPTQAQVDEAWQKGAVLQDGAVWMTADDDATLGASLTPDLDGERRIWRTGTVPHVTVDRITSMPQIFHTGRTAFADGCGLWFMAQGEEDRLQGLETVLAVLGDEGIGGLRSRGHGQFALKDATVPDMVQADSDHVVLLSRMAPTATQMALLRAEHASYELVLVGGFTGTPGRPPLVRRQVRMLREGSVIGAPTNGAVLGHLVDLTPEAFRASLNYTIWRSGLGLTAPIRFAAAAGGTQ